MPVDAAVQAVLDALAESEAPPLAEMDPAAARQFYIAMIPETPPDEVAAVEERAIDGPAGSIPIRIYTPQAAAGGGEPFPLMVYFHGGGWVIGNLDTHDHGCRALCNATGMMLISVDYRLAPEHPFPAAAEDAFAATVWVAENATSLGGDPAKLVVAGDSAGGNLAAVVSQMARNEGGPAIAFQLLIYPVVQHGFDYPSYDENGEGYLLETETMRWFWSHYLSKESDGESADASPLNARSLESLPPAHVISAEFDPLRDEGEDYARRLAAAGVPTTAKRYDGQIHGFITMPDILPVARESYRDIAEVLRRALG